MLSTSSNNTDHVVNVFLLTGYEIEIYFDVVLAG